jgi:hypothetical protein
MGREASLQPVRLSEERRNHILRHPEMVGLDEDIERAVATPDSVVESVSDSETRLYFGIWPRRSSGQITCAWWSRFCLAMRSSSRRT